MCERHRGYRRGYGRGRRRYPTAEEWLETLEERQRDLEQEAADLADLIRRLKEERTQRPAPETVSV
jgi:hypothetical protein